MTADEVRMECLKEAVRLCLHPYGMGKDPVAVAKSFSNYVLDLDDEEPFAWDGPDEEPLEVEEEFDPNEDVELKHAVRAYDDEGREL